MTLYKLAIVIVAGLAASTSVRAASDVSGVKQFLVETVEKMKAASEDFVAAADEYNRKIASHDGDPRAAYRAESGTVLALVKRMQEDYKAIDSYGYETVEGIVGGVESLSGYDLYLDAGLPKGEGNADETAPVTIKLPDGTIIDREGAPFTFLIEPVLWGSAGKYVVPFDLDGDGTVAPRESLPKPGLLTAVGEDVDRKIGELLRDARAWEASTEDCFGALVVMTPTLSDYFEDWKESRYTEQASGRFFAVSRISDMRGIMKSCSIMFDAVQEEVARKDEALSRAVTGGFGEIMAFLDKLDAREQEKGVKFSSSEIDELAAQAQSKTDKLVPQIKQAAALLKIPVSN